MERAVHRLECPVCGLPIDVPEDALDGEVLEHECGAMVEVVRDGGRLSLRPLEGVQEDWGE